MFGFLNKLLTAAPQDQVHDDVSACDLCGTIDPTRTGRCTLCQQHPGHVGCVDDQPINLMDTHDSDHHHVFEHHQPEEHWTSSDEWS